MTDSGVAKLSRSIPGPAARPSFDYLCSPAIKRRSYSKKLTVGTYDTNGNYYSIANGQQIRVTPDISMDADPYTGFLYGETFTIAGNAVADSGCMQTTSVYEFCEESIGGTSLASPLFAGTLALVLPSAQGQRPRRSWSDQSTPLQAGGWSARIDDATPLTDITPPSDPTCGAAWLCYRWHPGATGDDELDAWTVRSALAHDQLLQRSRLLDPADQGLITTMSPGWACPTSRP